MKPRIEVVAIDCLMLRLFDEIAESNMPWMLAASERLRAVFADYLIDLVPSYTTLMVHYDGMALTPAEARELIGQAIAEQSRAIAMCSKACRPNPCLNWACAWAKAAALRWRCR